MRAEGYSLEHVDRLIDFLENKIETNTVMPAVLAGVQEQLDAIDAACRDHPEFEQYYSRMLELQALIYGEGNQEQKALEFLKEAVRQTGSVGKLYSKLLKDYIANNSQPAPAMVPVVEDMPVEPEPTGPVEDYGKHASQLHERPRLGRMKVAFATAFGLVVVSVAGFHFVPRASALPDLVAKHSAIVSAKQKFDNLTAQYNACSAKLASERGSVDTNNMAALDAYNQDTKNCQAVLQQQHQAANRYDALIGEQ